MEGPVEIITKLAKERGVSVEEMESLFTKE
jgi:hypothetical protein